MIVLIKCSNKKRNETLLFNTLFEKTLLLPFFHFHNIIAILRFVANNFDLWDTNVQGQFMFALILSGIGSCLFLHFNNSERRSNLKSEVIKTLIVLQIYNLLLNIVDCEPFTYSGESLKAQLVSTHILEPLLHLAVFVLCVDDYFLSCN